MTYCKVFMTTLLFVGPHLGLCAATLGAQTVINLSNIDLCADCRLDLQEVARLGTATGPGMIEEEWTRVTRDPGRGVPDICRNRDQAVR